MGHTDHTRALERVGQNRVNVPILCPEYLHEKTWSIFKHVRQRMKKAASGMFLVWDFSLAHRIREHIEVAQSIPQERVSQQIVVCVCVAAQCFCCSSRNGPDVPVLHFVDVCDFDKAVKHSAPLKLPSLRVRLKTFYERCNFQSRKTLRCAAAIVRCVSGVSVVFNVVFARCGNVLFSARFVEATQRQSSASQWWCRRFCAAHSFEIHTTTGIKPLLRRHMLRSAVQFFFEDSMLSESQDMLHSVRQLVTAFWCGWFCCSSGAT